MIEDGDRKERIADVGLACPALALDPSYETDDDGRWFQWIALILALGHLLFASLTIGLRPEHFLADGLLAGLPWLGRRGRAFAIGALPLWITGFLTDNQWIWFALRGPIHLGVGARNLGLLAPGGIDWPAWFTLHPKPILDFFAGFAYSTHLVEVFGVGTFLFFARSTRFRGLCWAFLFANALGILIGMLYPAAPPWYVISHGLGPADPRAASSAGGAARFDALLGIHYFEHFYSRNPNVFGAMPSLHSAYPVVVAFAVWDRRWRWRVPALAYAVLMWFSAVYLAHHFFLDVLVGVSVATVSSVAAFYGLPALRELRSARSATVPES